MTELHVKENVEEEVICEMRLSVMEIYQERLKDLLSTQNGTAGGAWGQAGGSMAGTANLRIREHIGGSVWVQGLTEVPVTDIDHFQELMGCAFKKRVTGSHAMNIESQPPFAPGMHYESLTIQTPCRAAYLKQGALDRPGGAEMVRKTDVLSQRIADGYQ